jgi:serine/threonine-protein kinase
MDLAEGSRLGRYEVRSQIGSGGMGEVYLAEDSNLHRLVAIKLLPAEFETDTDRLRRFEREAFAASTLNHPNILTIHEIGAEDGHHFIATEYVDGKSLREHMREKRLELHECLDIGMQVAFALAAAHAAGIVHRDIKPENIMIRKDGIVKVLDFGLAKPVQQVRKNIAAGAEAPTEQMHNTAPGILMGTATYMSPEQARLKETDARTDIWSLGVVLYEMVAGRPPFTGETVTDVTANIVHREPVPLVLAGTDVPTELDRIVTKALRKDKEERYQVVKDLALDLKSLRQRTEFEAELERTETPDHRSRAGEHSGPVAPVTDYAPVATTGGDIHVTSSSAEYIVTEIRQHKTGALLTLAAIVALISVVGFVAYSYYFTGSGAGIRSVAVLPFQDTGGNPEMEYLSDGLSESLISALSRLPQLKVIARSSSFKYKGQEVDLREAAKALGVGAIVTGRVAERAGNLQISVEMVNAADGTQMWGEQYSRPAADVQAVQSEISKEIAEKLRLRLTGAQEQQLAKRATNNSEAYQTYLNGLYYQRKGGMDAGRKSLDYYLRAAELDPNFALAQAGAADTYRWLALNSLLDPKDALAKGKAAAQKALEIDDSLAEAHLALAGFRTDEWDWAGAEREYRRAIELNPNLAQAYFRYSQYLPNLRKFDEALAQVRRAQELDPLRPNLKAQEGTILYYSGRYDEAIRLFQDNLRIDPENGISLVFLGYAYASKGQYAEAIDEYQKEIGLDGESTSSLCYLGQAYAMSGRRAEALAVLDKLKRTKEYVSPGELAVLYTGLGDKEAAFESLERAYAAHDPQLQFLKVDMFLDPLRSDPRFSDLVRRVGLPQ